jgi:hypothetical protein
MFSDGIVLWTVCDYSEIRSTNLYTCYAFTGLLSFISDTLYNVHLRVSVNLKA